MALTQRLEFRQSQSLVMTPQLMQAIKLLQLSNLDLSAFVEEELERNPLLDRASDGPEAPVAILSDDTIVERLRESGIDIARRTVAKYREAMRIPSSVQRRRDKQSMLGNALSAPAASSDRSRDTAPA